MQLTLTNKLAIFAATLVAAFGMALTAFAYTHLEIEIDIYDDGSVAEVSYEEDGDTVTDVYSFDETDEDAIYDLLADELDIDVDTVKDASDVSNEDGDMPEDEDMNEDEDEGEDEDMNEDEDEDSDDSDYCDRTAKAAGWGVAKKCVDDEDYELNDKMVQKVERFQDRNMEKYQEYGKSTDKAVLQGQLQELLLLLISLLQQQMALQEAGA